MTFDFFIPGKPVGKGRPKFGNGRTYTPEKTVNYENLVQVCFMKAYPGAEPIKARVPVVVLMTAFYPIPVRKSEKQRDRMTAGLVVPTVKPDADNVAKIVLDALNGIAYYDDAQIVGLHVLKRYAEEPGVKVRITEYEEFLKNCVVTLKG